MFRDRLDADRFFARIRTFDLACPSCSRVDIVLSRRKAKNWDPTTSRWQCPSCGIILTFGIIGWPRKRGTRAAPFDWVPTWRESLDMRNQQFGRLPKEPKGNKEPVNVMLREGCSCRVSEGRRFVDDRCPVHGLNEKERKISDSKNEPRWMREKRQFVSGEEGGHLSSLGKGVRNTFDWGEDDAEFEKGRDDDEESLDVDES